MGRVCRVAVRGVWLPMSGVLATLGIGSNAKSTLESRPPPGEIGGCWRRWAVAVARPAVRPCEGWAAAERLGVPTRCSSAAIRSIRFYINEPVEEPCSEADGKAAWGLTVFARVQSLPGGPG